MRSFAAQIPLFAIGLVATLGLSTLLAPWLARRLSARPWVAWLLIFGFGLIVAATLLPHRDALQAGTELACDTSRFGFASLDELTRVSDTSLNVLLFVPLGIAVGLLPRTRPAFVITLSAVSLTFIVEGIQLVVTALGRGCQTEDLFDNLLGLAIGLALGLIARPLVRIGRG